MAALVVGFAAGFASSSDREPRIFSWVSAVKLAGLPRAAPDTSRARVQELEHAVIPASTPIRLELLQSVSSQSARLGDEVVAELAEPIQVGNEVVVRAGARVTGTITELHALRRVGGQAVLEVTFDRLEWRTGGAAIDARFRREAESETARDVATIAVGATIGSVLGIQAEKSDRGRMLGAVVGAMAATAVAANTPGETVELSAGSQLLLRLGDNAEVAFERS